MPKEGFVSITVDDEFYHNLNKYFQRNKILLKRIGVYSLSSFYSGLLETLFRNEELYNKTIDGWVKDIEKGFAELKQNSGN